MERKERGDANIIFALFMLVFFMILFAFSFRKDMIRYEVEYVDDGLSAAILASAYINLEEYGASHQIIIHNTDVDKDLVGNATQETYLAREQDPIADDYLVNCYYSFANCLGYNLKLQMFDNTDDGLRTNFIPENDTVLRGASGEHGSRILIQDYIVYNVYIDPIKRPASEEELLAAGVTNASDADTDNPNDAFIDESIPAVDGGSETDGMESINGIYYVTDGYVKTIYVFEYNIASDGELLGITLVNKYQCYSATTDAALAYDLGVRTPGGDKVISSTVYAEIGFCVNPFPGVTDNSQEYVFYKEKHRAVEIQTVIGAE